MSRKTGALGGQFPTTDEFVYGNQRGIVPHFLAYVGVPHRRVETAPPGLPICTVGDGR